MSLNNISLSSRLLSDLYSTSLIQTHARAVPTVQPVSFLGENKKHILILVNKEDAPYLPDKELEFLTTVLSACSLDLSAVAIINLHRSNKVAFTSILKQLQPKHLLLLDVDPLLVDLPGSGYYTIQQTESFQYLTAPSLAEIEKTKQAKSQLWIGLKQLFGI